jgi:polyhydroxyalkanoate synthesis regulator phasin
MKRSVTAAVAGVALAALIGVGVAAAADGTGPAGRVADVLSGLVSKGTITEEQAAAVSQALTDSWQQERAEREADRAARKAEIDALLQETLGMDSDAVRAQIQGGRTLREVAGNSADELAAGMLDMLGERLDTAVKDGRITQAQAEETLSRANARAKAWVAGDDTTTMGRGMGLGLLFGPGMGPDEGFGPGSGMGPDQGFGPGSGMGPRMGGDRGGPGMGHGGGPLWGDEDDAQQPDTAGTSSTAWRI